VPLGQEYRGGGSTRDHGAVMLVSMPPRSPAVVRSTFDDRGNGDDRTPADSDKRYPSPDGRA
jgi:hypothetical protein